MPDVETVGVVEHGAPLPDELAAVALRPGTPYGRTFRAVEHAELYCRLVGDDAHVSAQRVDFAHYLAFGNSAYGRVAAHLRYFVHVHGDEARACAHVCRGGGGLAAGVSAAYDDNIVV